MKNRTVRDETFHSREGYGNWIDMTTWWFGDDKNISEMCFDKECRGRDLYKMIP